MSDALLQALQITALGMGLVFGAIIVLWLMMILLTSFTRDRESTLQSRPELAPIPPDSSVTEREQERAQAAAIAVTMALAEQEASQARALSMPPTAIVSAWQLGMRTRLLAQKGNFRKSSRE